MTYEKLRAVSHELVKINERLEAVLLEEGLANISACGGRTTVKELILKAELDISVAREAVKKLAKASSLDISGSTRA